MEHIYNSTIEIIGNTPLLHLRGLEKKLGLKAQILAKVEFFNPTSSVKDRAAKYMLQKAKEDGILNCDTVVIEPTSGNTGIGLASACASLGHRAIFVMPETMTIERRKLLKAYGAEIVLTEGAKGMKGAIAKARELQSETPNSWIPSQFDNKANTFAHYKTTGPEIWRDGNGNIDAFVAGVGTGGTISGAGRFLKEKNKDIQVIAVEPEESPVLSGGNAGPHKIQGIGAGFVPSILEEVYDEVLQISSKKAYEYARLVPKTDGILVGVSSGAALAAATELAQQEHMAGKRIVVLLPDTGERYLSTDLFEE